MFTAEKGCSTSDPFSLKEKIPKQKIGICET